MALFAEDKKSCDQNMAALQALINWFLLQNEVCQEFHDVTKEDMVTWVRENTDINIRAPMAPERNGTDIKVLRHNSWT